MKNILLLFITLTLLVSGQAIKVENITSVVIGSKVTDKTINATYSSDSCLHLLKTNTSETSNHTPINIANNTLEHEPTIITTFYAGPIDKSVKLSHIRGNVDPGKYQLSMTVTSIVTVDGMEITSNGLELDAYIGDECRGTAILKYVDTYKRYMAFLMVWGNAMDLNKTISFKSFNKVESKELIATNESLGFLPENINGSPENPYKINFVEKITSYNLMKEVRIKVYPNPTTDFFQLSGIEGTASVTVSDLNGKTLQTKQITGNEQVSLSALPKGVYVAKITNGTGVVVKKLVKK